MLITQNPTGTMPGYTCTHYKTHHILCTHCHTHALLLCKQAWQVKRLIKIIKKLSWYEWIARVQHKLDSGYNYDIKFHGGYPSLIVSDKVIRNKAKTNDAVFCEVPLPAQMYKSYGTIVL